MGLGISFTSGAHKASFLKVRLQPVFCIGSLRLVEDFRACGEHFGNCIFLVDAGAQPKTQNPTPKPNQQLNNNQTSTTRNLKSIT